MLLNDPLPLLCPPLSCFGMSNDVFNRSGEVLSISRTEELHALLINDIANRREIGTDNRTTRCEIFE